MSMFMRKSGSIWLRSETDPRWNASTSTDCLVFSAGIPKELQDVIEQKKEQYGEPPEDLEWGGMKD